MLDSLTKTIQKLFGSKSERDIKLINPIVEEINSIFNTLASISDDELRAKTAELKKRIADASVEQEKQITDIRARINSEESIDITQKEALYDQIDALEEEIHTIVKNILDAILPEAFAVLKETARRFKENGELVVSATDWDKEIALHKENVVINGDKAHWKKEWLAAGTPVVWDMVHYDVQLIGGVVLHQGKIAEMATGEGKTLVATLPVFLNALPGRGVHLVTVNDYLAKRDSEWMAPLYEFHGLKVDCIDKHQPNSERRREAYKADITFGTNNEFGFDYLRDNMASEPQDLVQRKHNYAIVDEVDSVLIDDARTPLIISGPTPRGDEHMFDDLKPMVERLVGEQRKLVTKLLSDAKRLVKEAEESDKKTASKKQEEAGLNILRAHRGLPKNKALIKFLSESGMRQLLQKTENYYLQDQAKEMPFVDSELYFVIEEKMNSVELTEKGIELISNTDADRNFFILPDISTSIAAIDRSEKADEAKLAEKEALLSEYGIKSERVHTLDKLLKAYCMFEKDVEYVVMGNKVKIVDEQTGRIMEGRRYSDGLHQAIEAKESVTIEAATQTYATVTLQNYFRMYRKLSGMTGTAETEAGEFWEIYKLDVVVIPTNRPILRDDRNDLVYKTGREKYNAVIEEIEAMRNVGRPVLVGTTSVEVSELLSRMLTMRKIPHQVLNAKLHQKEADIVANAGVGGTVTIATNMAGRGTDIKLTPETKAAGGLAIIGTERHESRRVDRQLRGRAGRQGDPGSSQFFVSLEDNLMRLFGSERIASIMDRMGHTDGEVIQHSLVTRSIEKAQMKVEENNFGIRKNLLEYDNVMNQQREVIYKRRKNALFGERLKVDVANSIYDLVEGIVSDYQNTKDFNGFKLELIGTLHIETPVSETEFLKTSAKELTEKIYQLTYTNYQNKLKALSEMVLPVVNRIHEDPKNNFVNLVIPFTDGRKTLQILANLEKAYANGGKEVADALERSVVLAMVDQHWKDHLRNMDDLRQSVRGAVYEQKDPLLIYKFESFELFRVMVDKIGKESISFLIKAQLPQEDVPQQVQTRQLELPKTDVSKLKMHKDDLSEAQANNINQPKYHDPSAAKQEKREPIRVEKTFSRNDKVDIINMMTGETKTMKFKQAEPMLKTGQWRVKE
jgi:preprotein translocase subunit SecA